MLLIFIVLSSTNTGSLVNLVHVLNAFNRDFVRMHVCFMCSVSAFIRDRRLLEHLEAAALRLGVY